MRSLLALWVTVAVSGCYAMHQRDAALDAGPRRVDGGPIGRDAPAPGIDAPPGECSIDPGVIVGLDCPDEVAVGETITIGVRAHLLGCCAVSAPSGTTARLREDGTWEIEAPFSVCRCCEMCMCDPVVHTSSVTLGPASGDLVRVVARDLACDIRVRHEDCRNLRSDDWMAPSRVALGSTVPVRVFHDGGVSCGCTPRTELVPPEGPELSFLACGCSDVDPCIDPGYEATAISAPTTRAEQVQFYHPTGGGRVVVDVVPRELCIEDPTVLVDALEQVAPDPRFIAEDVGDVWIDVRGHAMRCCGEPAPLVEHAPGPTGELVLSIRDCNPNPCDCSMEHRVDFVEHHFVGRLAHGTTTRVRGGTSALDLVVP